MRAVGHPMARPFFMLGGLAYLSLLSIALIWIHLPPDTVLVLTAGGIGVVLLALRPLLAIHAFLALLHVENVVSTREGLTVMKMVGALVLASWLLSIAVRRRIGIRFDAFLVLSLLFLVWSGVSLVYAVDPDQAVRRVLSFAQLVLAALMFISVVDTVPRLRTVAWAIVGWTCVSTIVAIALYYAGATPVARGLVGDRNLLAAYINIAIVTAYFLFLTTPNALARFLLSVSLAIFFLGLALTFSRGGLLVLGVGLLAVWYRVARERSFLILLASAALLCIVSLLLPEAFWYRAASIVPAVKRQEDTFGLRVKVWQTGLRMIEDRPIAGVGPGNFVVALPRYARGEVNRLQLGPHSSYVGIAAELGLVGLALFLTLHLVALRSAARAARRGAQVNDAELRYLAVAMEVCIVVSMAVGLSIGFYYSKYLWIFFGLAMGVGRMSPVAPRQQAAAAGAIEGVPATAPAVGAPFAGVSRVSGGGSRF
ncbi:MAG: O-antigen ligase family protein [Candidatus Rokubacteria bacterium]|nr:O-antigen ligase family protein [Candidatus Rokubacteria bacterium]